MAQRSNGVDIPFNCGERALKIVDTLPKWRFVTFLLRRRMAQKCASHVNDYKNGIKMIE